MDNVEYKNHKTEFSYKLYKENRFFRKSRAIVVKDNEVLVIRIDFKDGRQPHYLLPGGGVDDGENIKTTAVRETLEEYGAIVEPEFYLGKQYYNVPLTRNGERFISRRVEFYYVCKYIRDDENAAFGIEGEFSNPEKTYTKTTLSLKQLKSMNCKDLNDMDSKNFKKLIKYIENKK
ncbi:MAG: NUDIX domain-containing protein [Clostridia bacterium]|nr:NUDIX domain-containing protein [Clostridia bacterium]